MMFLTKPKAAGMMAAAGLIVGAATVGVWAADAAEPGGGAARTAGHSSGRDATTAVIEASLTQGVAPLTVMFDALQSAVSNGRIVEYRWDFGDESLKNSRTGAGWLAAHRFVRPGEYEVKLSVQDESGGLANAAVTITVEEWKGRTYYLSSSEGDDSRTPEQVQDPRTPWKTLDKLTQTVARCEAGTHYLLKRGDTWEAETFRLPAIPQDAGNPVMIGAYGEGEKPVIQKRTFGTLLNSPPSCLTLQDLRFKGDPRFKGIGIDNKPDWSWCIFLRSNIRHLTLRRLTMEDFTLGIHGAPQTPEGSQYVFMEDCLVRNCGSMGWLGGCNDHALIRHNEFASNGSSPVFQHNIYFHGNAFLIEGNHIHHGSGMGINTHHTVDTIIRGNDLHDNGRGPGGAMGISWDREGNVLRHILVEGNNLHENFLGMWLKRVEDLTVRNNVIRNGKSTVLCYSGMDEFNVCNNTFYRNDKGAIFSAGSGETRYGGETLIANNIFYRDNASPPQPFFNSGREFGTGGAAVPRFLSNLYHASDADKSVWASLTVRADTSGQGGKRQQWTLDKWMAYVKEQGTVFGDPLFVDVESNDFHLQEGSPALGKGTSVGVADDFESKARDVRHPTIGAYEAEE